MRGLTGKAAVISGGASGIGFGAALRLAEEGTTIALLDIDCAAAQRAADLITATTGTTVHGVGCDVAHEESVVAAFAQSMELLGELDLLVVNAGIYLRHEDDRVHDLDKAVWDRIMSVNLDGAFLTAKHGVRALLDHGRGGAVVFVGSPNGLYACAPTDEAYSSSKAGVYGLARVMALDYAGDRIRVNIVLPGFTETPIARDIIADPQEYARVKASLPIGRAGTTAEIGAAIAFLLSDDASFMTGSAVFVDGGLTVQ